MLQERRNLGEAGFVHVTVVVGKNNELVGHPDIATLGWLDKDRSVQVLAELEIEIREAVLSALDSKNDKEAIERVIRRKTGKFVGTRTRRRPPISATVIIAD